MFVRAAVDGLALHDKITLIKFKLQYLRCLLQQSSSLADWQPWLSRHVLTEIAQFTWSTSICSFRSFSPTQGSILAFE